LMVSAPMPRELPVTSTIFPVKSNGSGIDRINRINRMI
jgi:hypothetical protein